MNLQRLGTVISQLEMNNAEARNDLRDMLQYQILQKDAKMKEEYLLNKRGYRDMKLKKSMILRDKNQLLKELTAKEDAIRSNDVLMNQKHMEED